MSSTVTNIARDLLELSRRLEQTAKSSRSQSVNCAPTASRQSATSSRPPAASTVRSTAANSSSRVSGRTGSLARASFAQSNLTETALSSSSNARTAQTNRSSRTATNNNNNLAVSIASASAVLPSILSTVQESQSQVLSGVAPTQATSYAATATSAARSARSSAASASASARTSRSAAAPSSGLAPSGVSLSRASASRASAASRASTGVAPSGVAASYVSQIEQAVLGSSIPLDVNEAEEVQLGGETGILLNREEIADWTGDVPLSEYEFAADADPEVITKRSSQKVEYVQELAIRYLRPPTPPSPGDIVINEQLAEGVEPHVPAPPVVIRQQPPRPETPEPLVIREAPPAAPLALPRQEITLRHGPEYRGVLPPRRVVVERLAALPAKPQSVIIERWLPYAEVKRRVVFNRLQQAGVDGEDGAAKNAIVQWEAPEAEIRQEFKYLGVVNANPEDYVSRYGASLVDSSELPDFVNEIETPDNLVLAANFVPSGDNLIGDVEALLDVDLEAEGLEQYAAFVQSLAGSGAQSALSAPAQSAASGGAGAGATSFNQTNLSTNQSTSFRSAASGSIAQSAAVPSLRAATATTTARSARSAVSSAAGAASTHLAPAASSAVSGSALGSAVSASAAALSRGRSLSSAPRSASTVRSSGAAQSLAQSSSRVSASGQANSSQVDLNTLTEVLFNQLDTNNTGFISIDDVQKLFLRLNSRLSRCYGEDDLQCFFEEYDNDQDGQLTLEDFRNVFASLEL